LIQVGLQKLEILSIELAGIANTIEDLRHLQTSGESSIRDVSMV